MENTLASEECWLILASAIIIRAVDDYRLGFCSRDEICRFLRSEYFRLLTRGRLDPEYIIARLEDSADGT